MKKFLRMLALLFVIVPCAMVLVACGLTSDPDKDPGKNPGGTGGNGGSGGNGSGDGGSSTPGQTEITAQEKTNIVAAFKSSSAAYTGSTYQTMYTRMKNSGTTSFDGEVMYNEEQFAIVKTTINNVTNEAAQRNYMLENEDDETGTLDSAYFVEKEGEKYVEYCQHPPITPEEEEYYYAVSTFFRT